MKAPNGDLERLLDVKLGYNSISEIHFVSDNIALPQECCFLPKIWLYEEQRARSTQNYRKIKNFLGTFLIHLWTKHATDGEICVIKCIHVPWDCSSLVEFQAFSVPTWTVFQVTMLFWVVRSSMFASEVHWLNFSRLGSETMFALSLILSIC